MRDKIRCDDDTWPVATRQAVGRLCIGAILVASLCAGAIPVLAQTARQDGDTSSAAEERLIITKMSDRKARIREALSKLLGRDKSRNLETSGSEVWSVPKEKAGAISKRAEALGAKVIRVRENWNQLLRRSKDEPVRLTP